MPKENPTIEKGNELEPFEIREIEGGKVLASIPGGITEDHKSFLGFMVKEYESRDQAEAAIEEIKNIPEAKEEPKEAEKPLERELEPFEIHEVTSDKVLASLPSATTIMENGKVGLVGFTEREFSSREEAEAEVNRWKNEGKE